MRRRAAMATIAAALPMAAAATGDAAGAKTFHVTRPGDDGRGTLRAAIERSNRHRGRDRVVYAKSLRRDIRLRRDLAVKGPLTITGRGRKGPAIVGVRTRSGLAGIRGPEEGEKPRIVIERVRSENAPIAVGSPLVVRDSTLTADRPRDNGIYMGWTGVVSRTRVSGWDTGISAGYADDVRVWDSIVTGNETGVEFHYSDGEVTDTTIARNERGLNVFQAAFATVETSRITGNSPRGGVAAGYYAGVDIRRSTIAGNEARKGGGVLVGGPGSAFIRNSTLSGNAATDPDQSRGGAIYGAFGREITISASTITGNRADEGSAIFLGEEYGRDDPPAIESSIVAGNSSAVGGPECVSVGQDDPLPLLPVSRGGNVFGPGGCGTTAASDVLTATPGLAPLADNGGPTPTHALLPDSPAIGNGLDLGLKTDQRGVARDGEPDSGSFERR